MRITATRARARGTATWAALFSAVFWAAAPAHAQTLDPSLSGYVTVATDLRKYGLSRMPDEPAVRLGIDYSPHRGFFAGGVAGNVSYPTRRLWQKPRDRLLELYAGYEWTGSNWGLTSTLGHYIYPDTSVDYDYSSVSIVLDYRDRFYYGLTYTDDLASLGSEAVNHELGITVPLPAGVELGASIGSFEARGSRGTEYTHWNAGATKLAGRFALDLRYYETSRAIVSYFGTSEAERWVFSLSYAIRGRD